MRVITKVMIPRGEITKLKNAFSVNEMGIGSLKNLVVLEWKVRLRGTTNKIGIMMKR